MKLWRTVYNGAMTCGTDHSVTETLWEEYSMNNKNFQLAVQLRHELHMHPELSLEEVWTKNHLMEFLKANTTKWEIVDRGRWFYAKYSGSAPKKKIAFRGDFDAIPVYDDIEAPWKSQIDGVGHKCGHDGHVANLCLTAMEVEEQGCENDVYLVFQHGEEIGGGGEECAELMVEEGIDEIYAFHNESEIPYNAVVVRKGTMCCASKGMEITLVGAPAHASTPEHGKNPSLAIAALINAVPGFIRQEDHKGLILATVIQVDIGERAFGVSAHKGQLLLTIRGEIEAEMDQLQKNLEEKAMAEAEKYGLECSFAYYDEFPETASTDAEVDKVVAACEKLNVPVYYQELPTRGSEDFGYFTKKAPGAIFWLGNGEEEPGVHDAKFDFKDDIMPTATAIFLELMK